MTAEWQQDWWSSLRHGGVLIGPSALRQYFPEPAPSPDSRQTAELRRALARWQAGADDRERVLLATVLETICGLEDGDNHWWLRGPNVPSDWTRHSITGKAIKPRQLWQGPNGARLPVFVDAEVSRLGIGHGRRSVSQVLEWLRASGEPLALLTNFRQWRLLYAGLDFDAWAQSDTDLWFEAGRPGAQVVALRTLLSPETLVPPQEDATPSLVAAIRASRKGQAEVSSELGERVRRAVEQLIDAHGAELGRLADVGATTPREIYLAATRVVMRLVVLLFAESRELLPRDNAVYHGSYSLEGLRDSLLRAGGDRARARLRQRFGAWPRALGLMRLVRDGSEHPDVPIPRYGGELFAPGDVKADNGVARALAVFENPEHGPDDAMVHELLTLLTRSRVKVRQGRRSTWVETAVDFSGLSSEYIGILYEGLLDFELRRSDPDDPMVFLALGKEPALPLSRLEAMDDKALKSLLESVKKEKDEAPGAEEEVPEEEAGTVEEDVTEADDDATESEEETAATDASDDDAHEAVRTRAMDWARRAAEAGRLVRKPRSRKVAALGEYEQKLDRAARVLIRRIVAPGEWFLVRWGGTRKGSGTFYTRPQLAIPTVHRTLRPLACVAPDNAPSGHERELLSPDQWRPRRPEEILALKVCDPAMGSGSFLVGALRYLTDLLYESLFHHKRIHEDGDRTLVTLLEGEDGEGSLADERLPAHPDDEHFEPRLRARLKRYVVERCIYGVDIDPLAVELARLALWVETMDRELPFEFLDHKLKVGNSLIGTWFDTFRDYPVMAWEREGGDKGHNTAVHHEKESWTKAIKRFRNELKPELADWIRGQHGLFEQVEGAEPAAIHDEALAALETIHHMPPQEVEEKSAEYRTHIEDNASIRALKAAMDAWCAVWFWPADRLDCAPRPKSLDRLSTEASEVVDGLRAEHRFFHWELEFPDVFTGPGTGFDAVLGNPPWDIQKPNSKEYFSNIDPLYRGYGKEEAKDRQRELFRDNPADERNWLLYSARFKALSNWCRHGANPFGDPEIGDKFPVANGKAGHQLHVRWRDRRTSHQGYADAAHPFRHQGGGDINSYKLFLESAHALLKPHGRLGMITPSGLYTDKGTTDLRELLVACCGWRWLFGFENRDRIFDIHRSYKFGPVIAEKGEETDSILTAFMHRDLADWERAERHVIPYPRAQIEKYSPWSRALLEIRARRDLEVLDRIYSNSVLLGDDGPDSWGIKYTTEFHMTNDSHLFKPRPWWEERGYEPDEYGRWIGPNGDLALPVYNAKMFDLFDFSSRGWVSGKGRSAKWRAIDFPKRIEPEYLMACSIYHDRQATTTSPRLLFKDISTAVHYRTMLCSLVPAYPAVNASPLLTTTTSSDLLTMQGILGGLCLDYVARFRIGYLHLNYFVISELGLPKPRNLSETLKAYVAETAFRLCATHEVFAPEWLRFGYRGGRPWRSKWAATSHERVRLRAINDALCALAYGLDLSDFQWLIADCDLPVDLLRDPDKRMELNPKGFWRVDRDRDPELRHPVLSLVAYHSLHAMIEACDGDRERGIQEFYSLNNGEGWLLPKDLRLADLDLGHDQRAKQSQPVRERMGPRFYEWQLEQSTDDSWNDCERHAWTILGEQKFEELMSQREVEREPYKVTSRVEEESLSYSTRSQRDLFQE